MTGRIWQRTPNHGPGAEGQSSISPLNQLELNSTAGQTRPPPFVAFGPPQLHEIELACIFFTATHPKPRGVTSIKSQFGFRTHST